MKRKELVQKKCLYIIRHQPHLIRLRYIQIYHFTDLVKTLQVVSEQFLVAVIGL